MSGKTKDGVKQKVENNARWAVSSPATKKEELCKRMRGVKGRSRGQMVHNGHHRSLATVRRKVERVHMQLWW